jgi:hypothetical protein
LEVNFVIIYNILITAAALSFLWASYWLFFGKTFADEGKVSAGAFATILASVLAALTMVWK